MASAHPKRSSQISSPPIRSSASVEAALQSFRDQLQLAKEHGNEIKISTDVLDIVNEILLSHRSDNTHFQPSLVTSIISMLDDENDDVCSRLNAPAYSTLLHLFLQKTECVDVERGLYLLAATMYRSAHSLAPEDAIIAKKIDIGVNSVQALLEFWTTSDNDVELRRWAGLLLIQLCQNANENVERVGFASENNRRKLGSMLSTEPNEILKIICAQLIRELIDADLPRDILWPRKTDEQVYKGFPGSSQSGRWNILFQEYLNKFDNSQDSDSCLYCAQNVDTIPAYNLGRYGHTTNVLTDAEVLTIWCPASGTEFDRFIEIPLDLATRMTINTADQSQLPSNVARVDLDFRNDKDDSSILNGRGASLRTVSMFLLIHAADYMREDLCKWYPNLDVRHAEKIEKQLSERSSVADPEMCPRRGIKASSDVRGTSGPDDEVQFNLASLISLEINDASAATTFGKNGRNSATAKKPAKYSLKRKQPLIIPKSTKPTIRLGEKPMAAETQVYDLDPREKTGDSIVASTSRVYKTAAGLQSTKIGLKRDSAAAKKPTKSTKVATKKPKPAASTLKTQAAAAPRSRRPAAIAAGQKFLNAKFSEEEIEEAKPDDYGATPRLPTKKASQETMTGRTKSSGCSIQTVPHPGGNFSVKLGDILRNIDESLFNAQDNADAPPKTEENVHIERKLQSSETVVTQEPLSRKYDNNDLDERHPETPPVNATKELQLDKVKKRKIVEKMELPPKRRRSEEIPQDDNDLVRTQSISPSAKMHENKRCELRPSGKVLQESPKLPKTGNPCLEARREDEPQVLNNVKSDRSLVNDHLSRKVHLVSFGAKGAMNQGPSSSKPSSQASRVDQNGSPKPIINAENIDHIGRVTQKLLQNSQQQEETASVRAKDTEIFGPGIKLSSITKPRPLSPTKIVEARYVKHQKIGNDLYEGLESKEIVVSEASLVDPFTGGQARNPNEFIERLAGVSKESRHPEPARHQKNANLASIQTFEPPAANIAKSPAGKAFKIKSIKHQENSRLPQKSTYDEQTTLINSGAELCSSSPTDLTNPTLASSDKEANSWNMVIRRSHYKNLRAVVHHIADEVIIRLVKEEDLMELVLNQYKANGGKRLDRMTEERDKEKAFIAGNIEQQQKKLVAIYSKAKASVIDSEKTIKSSGLLEFEKEWQKDQDAIQRRVNERQKTMI